MTLHRGSASSPSGHTGVCDLKSSPLEVERLGTWQARPSANRPKQLRLVVWNCAMALDRKWEALVRLQPDIAVVAECARPDIVKHRLGHPLGTRDALWVGRSEHKGLGVFCFGEWAAHLDSSHTEDLEFVAPIRVTNPVPILLLGVWAMNHRARRTPPDTKPGRQVQLALDRYVTPGDDGRVIVAGDFNDNTGWNKRARPFTMADCIDALRQQNLVSAYHRHRNVGFGSEPDGTLFWEAIGGTVNTYHIDYIWMPESWGVDRVDIGNRSQWYDTKVSDHVPLVAEIAIPEA